MKGKPYRYFIIFFSISLILLFIDILTPLPVKNYFFNLVSYPYVKVQEKLKTISRLKNENRLLRKKLSSSHYNIIEYKTLKRENKRLKSLLKFKQRKSDSLIAAKIIGILPNKINVSYVINKGKNNGIRENQPVISTEGVFGKVIKIGKNTSIVQSLKNYNMSISARDSRSDVYGIVRWNNGLIMEGIPQFADIEPGDTIVTSGMGSIYPGNLPVGTVSSIDNKNTHYSKMINIDSFENFLDPYIVFILIQ